LPESFTGEIANMKTLEEIKRILLEHKEEIRQKYGIIILGVFGSYARGEQKETSDVDIIVELERPIGLRFFELWDYLENILGIKVDVLTLSALKQKTLLWENVKKDILILQKGIEK
jgi:predicted nucleotidyltransferase